jgi:adenylosuccinate synthase
MIDVLLGLQFGDEGKGKIVDLITPAYDIVARFAGGCNAGHTLVFNDKKHVLHLVPSGIFHDCMNVIGNGCVIDPVSLMNEIKALQEMGVDVKSKLLISDKAHITTWELKDQDRKEEEKRGDKKIGTTLKGIGPTYVTKIKREGLRLSEAISTSNCEAYKEWVNFNYTVAPRKEAMDQWTALLFLSEYKITNTEVYLNNALKEGKNILAEGAQGALLDIDFGTYPFVTSSNTCVGGVITGLGVPPQSIRNVIGITKAYATRVGSGPFSTEQDNETGEFIRKEGNEFGSTTGRPRRCGWLDLHTLKYTCMINGVTELNIMKLDVLSNMDEINVCIDYNEEKPIYKTFKGWKQDISKINMFEHLPENCKNYINFVKNFLSLKITRISVGSDRKETIQLTTN